MTHIPLPNICICDHYTIITTLTRRPYSATCRAMCCYRLPISSMGYTESASSPADRPAKRSCSMLLRAYPTPRPSSSTAPHKTSRPYARLSTTATTRWACRGPSCPAATPDSQSHPPTTSCARTKWTCHTRTPSTALKSMILMMSTACG